MEGIHTNNPFLSALYTFSCLYIWNSKNFIAENYVHWQPQKSRALLAFFMGVSCFTAMTRRGEEVNSSDETFKFTRTEIYKALRLSRDRPRTCEAVVRCSPLSLLLRRRRTSCQESCIYKKAETTDSFYLIFLLHTYKKGCCRISPQTLIFYLH